MSSCPKLPFAAGSDGVVERFFGRRTEPPGSPEDLLVRTAEDMRLLVRDVGWRCADLPARTSDGALSDVHDDLRRIAGDLNRESEHIPGADQPLQVVLLGRTQAGKSTLFQYLTGSDGSPLGDGGQRTTQSVVTSRMAGRPDILVVDTPGVGARDGDDDREVALAAARHADLAVWVATSNAQPTETTEVLSQVARWGVPMVLVFNCRVDLTVDGAVHQFLAYPESTFADLEGHRSRLAPFLDRHGQRPLDVLPLHAAAALLG
ncbi:MAG TPA: GTPase domain-containing protein, partial [Acidimicrobiales bacterium]|nr:GTPase domain-containing protein [Acidimicrobiales bacterium]